MSTLKSTKLLPVVLLLAGLTAFGGCADLTVPNFNEPNREQALANPSDLVSLVEGATSGVFFEITNLWGVHMGGLADQMTSTNNFLEFWDFAYQPRLRLNNRTTYPTADIFFSPWSEFNAGVTSANSIIKIVEKDGDKIVLEDGTDVTDKLLASAYFLRGVSRGYIGMIYDQGYIVEVGQDLTALEPVPYSELIAAAVADLEKAMEVATQAGSFTWDLLPGTSTYDLAAFKEIANSFAARFLINEARTMEEAAGWPASRWNAIIDYAEAGVGDVLPAFSPAGVGPYVWYCNFCDWRGFVLSDNSGYLPTDIKVAHLLDPSYPVDYPDGEVVLDPMESNDPRAQYFFYTETFGFLNAARDRSLFTNYWNLRTHGGNNWGKTGYPVPIIVRAEMQYIKAEAYLWLNNKAAAAQALNNSPRGDVPTKLEIPLPSVQLGLVDYGGNDGLAAGLTMDGSESRAEFVRALHKEYSVELAQLGGIGIQWFFMRRHNLLQKGTPLHYAIPGRELQIIGAEYYTFGGVDYAGQPGTADGSNSWKTFDDRHNLNLEGASIRGGGRYGPQSSATVHIDAPQIYGGGRAKRHH